MPKRSFFQQAGNLLADDRLGHVRHDLPDRLLDDLADQLHDGLALLVRETREGCGRGGRGHVGCVDRYGARGAGILVGIADDGLDVTHGDFRNEDGTTRIKYLWNQAFPCGSRPDPPLNYGCLYTETDINNALGGMGSVVATDSLGHGSHVAGIAAGDGSQTGNSQPAFTYAGVAPDAALVVVKVLADPDNAGFFDGEIGDAVAFIDQTASGLGMPWVANVSLGYDHGGQ